MDGLPDTTYIGNSICCDGLPDTLSTNYNNKRPWLVAHNLDDDGMVDFFTMDELPSKYRCRIPELAGMHIRGFCHGWMILSNPPHDVMWSLWNPVTSKLIRLPPLPLEEGLEDMITSCCLSSPPGDPSSILLLTRFEKPNFVFCRLDHRSSKRKRSRSRSRWTEMSYAKQLKRLIGDQDTTLNDLTCCNGKVYALSHGARSVVLIDIKLVKDKQVVISILPFQKYPEPYFHSVPEFYVLKGSGTELFVITGRLDAPAGVYLFKLDMTTTHDDDTTWEEIHDLRDAVIFVELGHCQPVSYIPAVSSGLGGYVHIRDPRIIIINSFHVKDKTLRQLPMRCLSEATQVSMWEYRGLEADHNDGEVKCTDDDHKQQQQQQEEDKEENVVVLTRSSSSNYTEEESPPPPRLLDVPFHVLEMIMEYCVGIEYMNLRATCKRCHLAAPRIHWRNKTSLRKLEKYSLVSPWLMVVQANEGIMNFTDPISGDKYFMKLRLPAALSLSYDELNSISCSKYGWWLFYARSGSIFGGHHHLVFLNPFTNDVCKLPPTPPHYLENLCFSAPPTSTNCMVVGFSTKGHSAYILRYVEDQEDHLLWRRFDIVDYNNFGGGFCYPTFHGRDLYAMCNEGQVVVFKDIMSEGRFCQPEVVAAEWPQYHVEDFAQFFLMKRGQYLLLVIWCMYDGDPKLFQFNDSTKKWTQIQSLERDVVFVGAKTCLCIQEANPKMQNKIYFPRRFKADKLIFYSLETSKFHTFDGKLATREEAAFEYCCVSFRSALHLSLNAWIQPSWS